MPRGCLRFVNVVFPDHTHLLFLYYIPNLIYPIHNDLSDAIAEESHGINIETIKLFVLLFADDLVSFAETVIDLQHLINKLIKYCAGWHINVNLSNTMVTVFRNGGPLRSYGW